MVKNAIEYKEFEPEAKTFYPQGRPLQSIVVGSIIATFGFIISIKSVHGDLKVLVLVLIMFLWLGVLAWMIYAGESGIRAEKDRKERELKIFLYLAKEDLERLRDRKKHSILSFAFQEPKLSSLEELISEDFKEGRET